MRAAIRVLIVDDEPSIREMLDTMLSLDPAFEVVGEAGDGAEAIERASETCPDAILLDLMMPGMSGIDALPVLRERCPDAKVVVCSAKDAAAESLAAGAAGFLLKTDAASHLRPAITAAVGG